MWQRVELRLFCNACLNIEEKTATAGSGGKKRENTGDKSGEKEEERTNVLALVPISRKLLDVLLSHPSSLTSAHLPLVICSVGAFLSKTFAIFR